MKLFNSLVSLTLVVIPQLFLVSAVVIPDSGSDSVPNSAAVLASDVTQHVPADSSDFPILLSNINFSGVINGEKYTLNGSAKIVIAQLEAKYPGVNLTDLADDRVAEEERTAAALLSKRHKIWPPLCVPVAGQPWTGVREIEYVVSSRKMRAAGRLVDIRPKSCARVSCEREIAIIICNDSPDKRTISTWYIATCVHDLWQWCRHHSKPQPWYLTGGQAFDDEGWNVILTRERC